MALKAGRVGVAPSEVDAYGKLKGGGGGQRIDIVNGLNETEPGKALDAVQGKVLNDKIEQRISLNNVIGLQIRGSGASNNLGFRVFKNSEKTAWTQMTASADNSKIDITQKEADASTEIPVANIYSAGGIFQIKSYTYEYTCQPNANVNITGSMFGVATPAGYTPVGAVSWFTGSQYCFVYRITPQNTGANVVLSIHNVSASAVTVSATINILYAKNISISS